MVDKPHMVQPLAKGIDQAGAGRRVDLRPSLADYPHKRTEVVGALSSSSPSVGQLGMSLKLGTHKHQVVRGVERALGQHRKEMAERSIRGLGK